MFEAVIIIGLAAWRLTSLVGWERGPFNVFERFRSLLGFEHDDTRNGMPVKWPSNVVTEAIACTWCLGLYSAAASYGLWVLNPWIPTVIAASAVVILMERYIRGN